MPTVGWIWEGDWDRYFDAHPLVAPDGPFQEMHRCPFCPEAYSSYASLLDHLASLHRGERPVLLINGAEPIGEHRVSVPLHSDSCLVENCTSCTLSVDGAPATKVDIKSLRRKLPEYSSALLDIELSNQFDRIAQPIQQRYRLIVRIATRAQLDAVDREFLRLFSAETATFTRVDEFLSLPCCKAAAYDYAEALSSYVRGILVKDRPAEAAVTLPYASYRDLYGQALGGLQFHRRPLSDLISATLRFARNDFRFALQSSGSPVLDCANCMLSKIAGTNSDTGASYKRERISSPRIVSAAPVDDGISRALMLMERLNSARYWSASLEEECRQTSEAVSLDAPDREKALALWAVAALRLGCAKAAQDPLARLSATYPFGTWASAERERMPYEPR